MRDNYRSRLHESNPLLIPNDRRVEMVNNCRFSVELSNESVHVNSSSKCVYLVSVLKIVDFVKLKNNMYSKLNGQIVSGFSRNWFSSC